MNDDTPGLSDAQLRDLWDAEVVNTPVDRSACPLPEALLEAVADPAPAADDRLQVLLHVAQCVPCREEAALVRAMLAAAAPVASPEPEVEGPGLEPPSSGRSARRGSAPGVPRFRAWATAASVLLVAGGAGTLWWAMGEDGSAVRGGEGRAEAPRVTCATPGEMEIRWGGASERSDTGVVDYRVEVFADDGTVLAEVVTATAEARVSLPAAATWAVDAEAPLVRVETRFADGRVTSSPSSRLPETCRPPR
jgi:hypothetical protein